MHTVVKGRIPNQLRKSPTQRTKKQEQIHPKRQEEENNIDKNLKLRNWKQLYYKQINKTKVDSLKI